MIQVVFLFYTKICMFYFKHFNEVMISLYIMLEPKTNKAVALLQASGHAARLFRYRLESLLILKIFVCQTGGAYNSLYNINEPLFQRV